MSLTDAQREMQEALARIEKNVERLLSINFDLTEKLIRSERDLAEAEARLAELQTPDLRLLPRPVGPYEVVHGDGHEDA